MNMSLNLYDDHRIETKGHFGVDISLQRADDLDKRAVEFVTSLENPRTLDAASATGGQAIRMASAGATSIALDMFDYSQHLKTFAKSAGVDDRCEFVLGDLSTFSVAINLGTFDAIVCQRMIHYVPFKSAVAIVTDFARALNDGGRLFISASGIHSELGNDYEGVMVPIDERYCALHEEMVRKHDINGPVCLYSEEDMALLLAAAGLKPVSLYSSEFGNIKAEAMK